MLANKKGSASEQELQNQEAIPQQGVNAAMGMMGSTNPITGLEGMEAQAAGKAALNNELGAFGGKVKPENIVQGSTPLQPMPIQNSAVAPAQDPQYFQKLLELIKNK